MLAGAPHTGELAFWTQRWGTWALLLKGEVASERLRMCACARVRAFPCALPSPQIQNKQLQWVLRVCVCFLRLNSPWHGCVDSERSWVGVSKSPRCDWINRLTLPRKGERKEERQIGKGTRLTEEEKVKAFCLSPLPTVGLFILIWSVQKSGGL